MGRLLVDEIDILIVDEMGKDSVPGFDSNVTGRSSWGLPGFVAPPIQRIIVRDLTRRQKGMRQALGLQILPHGDLCRKNRSNAYLQQMP